MNILISSAGRRVGLLQCWREALSELGLEGRVLVAELSSFSSAAQLADEAFLVPRCTDEAFVPFMLALCAREQVKVLVPTIDTELPIYARHRADFLAVGVTVLISSPEAIALGFDKNSTHRWLIQEGFPTVEQTDAVDALSGGFPLPAIAKPVRGSSSIGVAVVNTRDELRMLSAGQDYVVQTIAQGDEYTVSVWVDGSGRSRCAVPRKRIEVRHGEVSKGVTRRHAGLEELASRICERLPGAFGPMNVQVFLDEKTGTLKVIEINARFGGGFPLAFAAGARVPTWILEELLALPSTAASDAWSDGLVMLRYDEAVYRASSELTLEKGG